jgi:hypothetical protein
LQEKVQALPTQTALALATFVVHACPQDAQLFPSLVGSTQLPPQRVGAAEGHPDTQEYVPPAPAHTFAAPVQAVPQLPQLAAVASLTQAPAQRLYPPLHANEQPVAVQVGTALSTEVVHALPHVPQLEGCVRSTHSPPHAASPSGQPPSEGSAGEPSPESAAPPSISSRASKPGPTSSAEPAS